MSREVAREISVDVQCALKLLMKVHLFIFGDDHCCLLIPLTGKSYVKVEVMAHCLMKRIFIFPCTKVLRLRENCLR